MQLSMYQNRRCQSRWAELQCELAEGHTGSHQGPSVIGFDSKWPNAGLARRTDPETSKTAARSIKPRLLESLVLGVLRRYTLGGTTSEIADHPCLPRDTISPRMAPMERRGLVVRTSKKRDGRIVWRLA